MDGKPSGERLHIYLPQLSYELSQPAHSMTIFIRVLKGLSQFTANAQLSGKLIEESAVPINQLAHLFPADFSRTSSKDRLPMLLSINL
jgi:hypothetical protein